MMKIKIILAMAILIVVNNGCEIKSSIKNASGARLQFKEEKINRERAILIGKLLNNNLSDNERINVAKQLYADNCWDYIPRLVKLITQSDTSFELQFNVFLVIEKTVGIIYPSYDFICPLNTGDYKTKRGNIIVALNDWCLRNQKYKNRKDYITMVYSKLQNDEDRIYLLSLISCWSEEEEYRDLLERIEKEGSPVVRKSAENLLKKIIN